MKISNFLSLAYFKCTFGFFSTHCTCKSVNLLAIQALSNRGYSHMCLVTNTIQFFLKNSKDYKKNETFLVHGYNCAYFYI